MTDRPSVYTIAPNRRFISVLAKGLLHLHSADPLALSRTTVLLPTRRACRALQHAFLHASAGQPLLLPRLIPLGDLDELDADLLALGAGAEVLDLPPVMPPLQRQMMLAELVRHVPQLRGEDAHPPGLDHALKLASALMLLQDEVETERLSFDRLPDLVPADYADHWQLTLQVLALITEAWPTILEERGAMNPMAHRDAVFSAIAQSWQEHPPQGPVIAAGSTGSIPATADLLSVISALPEGTVILPGLDQSLDQDAWDQLEESHPQFGLKLLLDRLDVARTTVPDWQADIDDTGAHSARAELVSQALRPAATTAAWRDWSLDATAALADVDRIECMTEQEEAGVIALVLREALEQPEQTACLITPDRALARRVSAALARWDVTVDDSAGQPLAQSPPATFLRLLWQAVAYDFAPVELLALLKHPFSCAGWDRGAFLKTVRRLEQEFLRGPRREPGLAPLLARVPADSDLHKLLSDLQDRLAPVTLVWQDAQVSLADLLRAHAKAGEALAETHESPGALRLWAGEAGTQLASLFAEAEQAAMSNGPISPAGYGAVFDTLVAAGTVRPPYGTHPRVSILGPLEARLIQPDLVVLGGLNEGTWPQDSAADPWMSRPMRKAFGLPGTDRRVGLAAHDFAQAFCAKRVVLTRAKRVDQSPTVPSRWLRRLEACITASSGGDELFETLETYTHWANQLDAPKQVIPALPPSPTPPVAARPRALSVTRIETWMRDPYAIYAERILKLSALDPLDAEASAADYGTIIHKAFELFIEGGVPEDAEQATATLIQIGHELLAEEGRPALQSFWLPRWERIATWAVANWGSQGLPAERSAVELKGTLELDGPAGPFTLSATADRIDLLPNQTTRLIDYKTGAPPTQREVEAGFAPQLPLEVAITTGGGFPGIPASPVSEASFWHVHGRGDGGAIRPVKGDLSQLADDALEGLRQLIARFDDPSTAYPSQPVAQFAPKYSNYTHLARIAEWATEASDDG